MGQSIDHRPRSILACLFCSGQLSGKLSDVYISDSMRAMLITAHPELQLVDGSV